MRTEVIKADTIDAAVERILDELKNTRSRENAIYFDGWDGLGASAVLRAVAQRLAPKEQTRPPGLEFEQVIHIDSSKWKSRRAVQREISEQLKLPGWVKKAFDKQDEEDDFSGIAQGSRTEIAEVTAEIHRSMQSRRFLLVLHNGSSEEIDTFNLGLSLYGYLSSKMLWTFQGRFRFDPKLRDKVVAKNTTDVLLLASRSQRDPHDLWSYLVREEATQVSCKQAATVAECYLYMLERSYMSQNIIDYEWTLHAPSFWICDGIIQQAHGIHEAWQVSHALHQEMGLCIDKLSQHTSKEENLHTSHMIRSADHRPYWISTETCGFVLNPGGLLPNSMFQNPDQISVLKLSQCAFSFSSPPFLCCHRLRFLWLDRCQDLQRSIDSQEEKDTTRLWACFQSLWVLDLRYMDWSCILSADMMDLMIQLIELNIMGAKDWDMSCLRGRLRNIRKLRITKSTCRNYDLLSEMEQMEILEFCGNDITSSGTSSLTLCSAARRGSGLQTVIVDGSVGLKKISLQGCVQLKNVLLRGLLESLEELDLSGTNLQTIDLSALHDLKLKQLLLLGCQKLHAILWPRELNTKWLDVLRIDTTSRSASDSGGGENLADAASARSSPVLYEGEALHAHPHDHESLKEQKGRHFNKWRVSVTDARLLRSLLPVMYAFSKSYRWDMTNGSVHIDICSADSLGCRIVQVQTQPNKSTLVDSKYRDAFEKASLANSFDDCGNGPTPSAVMMMWDCPKIEIPITDRTCMIEMLVDRQCHEIMEDAQIASNSGLSSPRFPDSTYHYVTSLHVYDCPTITSIYAPQRDETWPRLRWCRVERCPKIHTVFHTPRGSQSRSAYLFKLLQTFWASQLLKAHYISNWPSVICHPDHDSFGELEFLHVDYCPRLIHVIPIQVPLRMDVLRRLTTIEILCCGDLREIFPLHFYRESQKEKAIVFPNLKHIHLHELPKLQHICVLDMNAPMLETVKIRGCWSLKRLPAVGDNTKLPKVDCEKDWWESLEWDGLEAKHHPSLYKPTHSAYYKKKLPRVSLLR
ncbi:uncharacterized protein LOC119368944 isoform X2 [Triticum dicoccoides]|uniref:uncharacterized protein LOC119368944 isoform X1 n=1 Tax=Triticum dicoccoides TaxID=85692 RepID=UPI00188DDEC7|nr:uncharacterized protein LOC119368944 isoform X1 [Triticum dicoccoides]XP_037489945.1 uncharacterized protein LOC119368944 isoform X2 [Triticum dicoccoides]